MITLVLLMRRGCEGEESRRILQLDVELDVETPIKVDSALRLAHAITAHSGEGLLNVDQV